ncbi:ATP-dependent helicase [Burkholderia sp. 9775_39]|uniref:ATP-dependent helicase n=1 Tax=unclassified Burkholderia TaxID=2613784 RepID=UPI0018C40EA2|nr:MULTISPECIES: ATP-dependent helicase [unclassified Burkholderia]MBG0880344.1 ATP-dependent helicase [Burkholderia sp. 9775_39]MBG0886169.1 ATP-dependent helicase [Burkholderia sp. 9773_38]
MLDELNPQQREVALLRRHCLAIACPGAGKTKMSATKAAWRLQDPAAMVGAVTFSKDAAVELRERILALAPPDAKRRLIAGTFHSLAYKQLQQPGRGRPDIASDGDRLGMLGRVLAELGFDWKVEEAVPIVERIKTNFGRADEGSAEAALYTAYQEALERNGKIDFQDMLRLAVERMQSGEIKPYRFTDLLVDEFQDTDPLQFRWVELHARAGTHVTVVGDDDQSIYGFRAALGFRGMETFASTFEAQRVVLGSNYRCRAEILAAADRVIQNNIDRMPKVLHAARGAGGAVAARRFVDEYEDAVAAVEALQPKLAAGASCAILARTNRILDPIESVCRSQCVPYYRASGGSVLNKPQAALMCNLLQVVEGHKQNGIDAVLGYMGMSSYDLGALHKRMGTAFVQLQKQELVGLGLREDTATAYRAFMKRLGEWQALCQRSFHSLALEGVYEWMMTYAKGDVAIRAIQCIYDVVSRLNGSFTERIEFLKRDNNKPGDGVLVLTTMHSSKGLEYDHVWISRSEEGVVPDDKSPESEERRLFYVAMTRARDSLTISSIKKNAVSRFVIESGIEQKSTA